MLISKIFKCSLQSGSVMPRDLSIFAQDGFGFCGSFWFHMDGITDGDGMWAETHFRLSGVGSQVLILLCLFLSAVAGVAVSIVGSSKFKGVYGLYFSSWANRGKTDMPLTWATSSGTPVVQPLWSLHCIHLQRKERNWAINSVVFFSNQKLGRVIPGVSVLLVYVDLPTHFSHSCNRYWSVQYPRAMEV